MEFLRTLLVFAVWWIIFIIADFLEKKMPVGAYSLLRWVFVLPAAVLGYLSAAMVWSIGVFWATLSFPAFVGVGMITAPKRRAIPGAFLLLMVIWAGAHEFKDNWEESKTRRWMSAAIGMTLAGGTFWKLKDLEDD